MVCTKQKMSSKLIMRFVFKRTSDINEKHEPNPTNLDIDKHLLQINKYGRYNFQEFIPFFFNTSDNTMLINYLGNCKIELVSNKINDKTIIHNMKNWKNIKYCEFLESEIGDIASVIPTCKKYPIDNEFEHLELGIITFDTSFILENNILI